MAGFVAGPDIASQTPCPICGLPMFPTGCKCGTCGAINCAECQFTHANTAHGVPLPITPPNVIP